MIRDLTRPESLWRRARKADILRHYHQRKNLLAPQREDDSSHRFPPGRTAPAKSEVYSECRRSDSHLRGSNTRRRALLVRVSGF